MPLGQPHHAHTKKRCIIFRNRNLNEKLTCGFDLVESTLAWLEEAYFKALRELIAHCLIFEPFDRPDLVSLQKKTINGLQVAKSSAVKEKLFEDGGNMPLKDYGRLDYDGEEVWVEKRN